jgi:hypothetical protein
MHSTLVRRYQHTQIITVQDIRHIEVKITVMKWGFGVLKQIIIHPLIDLELSCNIHVLEWMVSSVSILSVWFKPFCVTGPVVSYYTVHVPSVCQ